MLLFLFAGCGKERIADIATDKEISDKSLLFIFPSVPDELCYADSLTQTLNNISEEINGTNPQVISINKNVDCSDYGFVDCAREKLGKIEGKEIEAISCFRESDSKICNYMIGDEYEDAQGDTFDQTCVLGIEK